MFSGGKNMIISIPDKFLIEIENEKYFIRKNTSDNSENFSVSEEIDDEYINSVKN